MTLAELIAKLRADVATKLTERNLKATELTTLRAAEATGETVDAARVETLRSEKAALDTEIDVLKARADELQEELTRDQAMDAMARSITPAAGRPAYDGVARVGQEARTYRPDEDPRGVRFARDVIARHMGDWSAGERLSRHMTEEAQVRGQYLEGDQERAVGTGAFAGLVVPQYLVDMFAPMATAGRPFADAMNHHDLPATGMVVNIGRGTTGTSAANQSAENATVSETDYDDTLLSIPVQTSAGSQTVSRQGVERGANVEDTIMEDLVRRNAANIDFNVINQATTGLTNVATATAYTDASPTGLELYPKVIEALSKMEASLMDVASGENLAVMHSRRWYWLQNILGAVWPLISQPGIVAQHLGANYAERYGNGIRGMLPNGTPVLVDNNVAINLGAGTNEDEIYTVDRRESHLWEDPNAPFFIRADQPKAKTLGIDLVVYSYYAYTHARYAHAQKVGGTGLITPTFTGA